jgi:DNA ligase-1
MQNAPDGDRLWALALLSGRRPKRTVGTTKLKEWACQFANIDFWLFEESYSIVGDLAETITLIIPPPTETQHNETLSYWVNYIRGLEKVDEEIARDKIIDAWRVLSQPERFAFNKLITGGFRVGISQTLVGRAITSFTGITQNVIA